MKQRTDALHAFSSLLRERAVPIGLVAAHDRDRLFERHVLDSVRALPCLPAGASDVIDIGSGAGLPGIPLAIARPDSAFVLLEPISRRAAFSELVAETLGLSNVRVVVGRAESVRLESDVCLTRAIAGPERSWALARGLLRQGGRLLYWAGRSWEPRPASSPADVVIEVCEASSVAGSGPLVMMHEVPPGPVGMDGA